MIPNHAGPITPWARQALGPGAAGLRGFRISGKSPQGPWRVILDLPNGDRWDQWNAGDIWRGVRAALEWANGNDGEGETDAV